jgi:hypothetical protein
MKKITAFILAGSKSQKRGPNLPRGGAGMLELRNVLNIKEFSENLRS